MIKVVRHSIEGSALTASDVLQALLNVFWKRATFIWKEGYFFENLPFCKIKAPKKTITPVECIATVIWLLRHFIKLSQIWLLSFLILKCTAKVPQSIYCNRFALSKLCWIETKQIECFGRKLKPSSIRQLHYWSKTIRNSTNADPCINRSCFSK